MKLSYLTTKYPSVSHTFIRRELREIERRGHSVLRLAIRKTDAILADPLDQEEELKTIHCLALPAWHHVKSLVLCLISRPVHFFSAFYTTINMGRRSNRGILRHIAYLIEACTLLTIIRKHDIQHVHTHFGTNSTAVARLIRRLGGPGYSFTVHGPDEFDAPVALDLRGKISEATFVVAITDYCSAQLMRWSNYTDWEKIHVVHCMVGDDFFSNAEPVPPDSNTFVCIGRLATQKAHVILIEAFQKLIASGRDAKLILVGDGELRPVIEEKIKAYALEDYVHITGYVSDQEVRRYIKMSRALVLPSFAEGLPMVIMESFAVGRPVITTYIAGIPELVEPNKNGWLVPAGNVTKLTDAMIDALDTPIDRLSEMAEMGRNSTFQQHYTTTVGDHLENLLSRYTAANE